jgi:hypothetical protein
MELEMRYLICALWLIAAVVIPNQAVAEEYRDCGIIADPKARVDCQVESRIAKTKSTSRKVRMYKEKEDADTAKASKKQS